MPSNHSSRPAKVAPAISEKSPTLSVLVGVAWWVLSAPLMAADFNTDVRPILVQHCLSCHGSQKQEGGLRLDQRAAALRGGDGYAPAIVPKSSETSPLFQFVSREDADLKMPPKGPRLSVGEVQTLKEWIDDGAEWPDSVADIGTKSAHWSFQPLVRPEIPRSSVAPSTETPHAVDTHAIDAFVQAKLTEQHLAPNPPADRRTLIRRLSFDLLGVPPSPEEIAAFEADTDLLAYEKLVDRYLASPQFGERAARFWLDTVRFAESDGFETNQPRPNAWRYRDYVIDAFNRDLPYDQFVKQQLAGDQLGAGVATGFLVGGAMDRVKSPDPILTAQQRADELHDMVSTTGSVFLGLTVGCARCHSHKFDPIPQTDYYAMKAVFEGVMHGDREMTIGQPAESEKRVAELQEQLAVLDTQLREFEPLASLRETLFVKPTDLERTVHLHSQPAPAIAKGTQRGASLDPGVGSHWPNLSAGYLYWKLPPQTDAFAWKPKLSGTYRFWTSWGCGHVAHSTEARYLLDRDGDLKTTEDQREILRANHQRFADGSDLIPEQPLWSGLKDAGVVELLPESVVLLRAGDDDKYVAADVAVFQAVPLDVVVEDRPALRVPVTRDLNVERFAPVQAKHLRFTVLATSDVEPCIDELEVFASVDMKLSDIRERTIHQSEMGNHGTHGREEWRKWFELTMSRLQIASPYPEGVAHHSPGSRPQGAHPGKKRLDEFNPEGVVQRLERDSTLSRSDRCITTAGNAVKDFSRITFARWPTRFRPPLPRDQCGNPGGRFAGERVGVRGPYRSLKPPHPGPLPHSGVYSESGIDCGGEGAESRETPRENPSRRCPSGLVESDPLNPGCATPSRPWAVLDNPFGVKRPALPLASLRLGVFALNSLFQSTAHVTTANIALASLGTKATASGTYPNSDIHKLEHLNDGIYGNSKSWISNEKGRGWVQLEFPDLREISEVRWSRDRATPPVFADRVATQYTIEVSLDGQSWTAVATHGDRLPYGMTVPGSRLIRAEGADAQLRFVDLQARRATHAKELAPLVEKPKAYAGQFINPGPTHRLNRGDVSQPKEVIAPASLSELGTPVSLPAETPEAQRRLALAEWMVSPDNPLTARVIVNRLWLQHFGEGIVDTPSDLGANGGKPSHPELLNWLACELRGEERRERRDERQEPELGNVEPGSLPSGSRPSSLLSPPSSWSLKHIHRLICLSETYRQSSDPREDGVAVDAASRLLWRYPPRRMEAEAIRDAILTVSGQLDLTPGGPGFDLFEANTNYVKVYNSKRNFIRDDFRRMVYQSKPRMQLEDTFGTFDCPDAGQVTPKRTSSTTALQALSLLNSPFLLQQSLAFAERVEQTEGRPAGSLSHEERVDRAFQLAFGRPATPDERVAAVKLVEQHGLPMLCRALYNAHEFVTVR